MINLNGQDLQVIELVDQECSEEILLMDVKKSLKRIRKIFCQFVNPEELNKLAKISG